MIKIHNFTFQYHETPQPALKNINLEIGDGEFILITGSSGGGKSSLCRCINGLIPHFYGGKMTGSVDVQGLNTRQHDTRELATRVGMIFQDPENQLITQDVEREIAFGLENLACPRDLISRRIEESLDTLGISNLRHRPIHELSGGEKQKVAIASVLALHPEILMLDEPTSELDPKSAEEVLTIIQRLNDELGITIILIEHRLDRIIQHTDRLIVLDEGEIMVDDATRTALHDNYQRISDAGIGLPPIIKLAHQLEVAGISNNNQTPLTVKEGRIALQEVFQKTPGQLSYNEHGKASRPVIEVEKMWYAYPDGITALKNVSLTIHEGEFVAIMGRNASGKTTLVKHFNGLLKPTRGSVSIHGKKTHQITVAELAREVGFVFQNPNDHLLADTVEEEIGFTLKNFNFTKEEVQLRTDEVMARFRLDIYRKQYPRSLSGGEKQRVALASVMAIRPGILVLDEPTRGMEYRLKTELMEFLQEYVTQGNTVILVTHDVETVAEYADRVILLGEGRIIVDDSKREVLSRALLFSPQINRLVQAFERYGVPTDILTIDEVLRLLT